MLKEKYDESDWWDLYWWYIAEYFFGIGGIFVNKWDRIK